MSWYGTPRSAFPYAPHWTMPTPCPQPRPESTTESPAVDVPNHREGTVWGRRVPSVSTWGYRPGSRQWAHALTSDRNETTSMVRDVFGPLTTTSGPSRRTAVTLFPAGQEPARVKNVATSENRSDARQRESGDALSSFSVTGRRYGSGS